MRYDPNIGILLSLFADIGSVRGHRKEVKMAGRRRRQELDAVDRRLVAELKRDGRAPNVALAKSLGVSEKTVRLRIARLQDAGKLRISAELTEDEPRSRMIYLVKARPGERIEVAEFLAAQPGAEIVYLTTGAADVIVVGAFDDDTSALRFQVQTIEGHEGVASAESCHLITKAGVSNGTAGGAAPAVDPEVLATVMGLARGASLEELSQIVCTVGTAGLGADRVLVVIADDSGRRPWRVTRSHGISTTYLNALDQLIDDGLTDGVIKKVWQTQLHMLVTDARTDPLFAAAHGLVLAEGYVSILTLPMLYGDSLVASISLYYDSKYSFDETYVATAQGAVDSLTIGIARSLGKAPSFNVIQR
ncbi:AsnC family transcriptional regulator [Pseudonocardia abyssalis]|uniref:AsnC family transcriptional regulator n=1 Tax=Pseudonocardia abyssalis TaxID=2792008 RepID=A0ABS6UYU1_9PSEU|nr:AsnC family transcriptional regulator [Pseudonocardia abyssalis]MBW0115745.1 AsnC family transcriptional regulator [Pseudonocardia abyssalis]MBW0137418.1 AsnC family transcriptional regulator [Pseudonocardia abyssalis]